jgi:hypothetical protein
MYHVTVCIHLRHYVTHNTEVTLQTSVALGGATSDFPHSPVIVARTLGLFPTNSNM